MTSFFSAEGGPIWIKFRRLVQNDMLTVVMWSKSKPDVKFQYSGTFGRIQRHVVPELSVTLQGAATWRIQCHEPRATCHIAGCWHRANSMACHDPRATYHIAGCCHLMNSLPHATLEGTVTWRNQCRDRATLQNSIRHIENRFSAYFIFVFNAV